MTVDVNDLGSSLYDSISLIARRLKQAPAPGELTLPERSALSRLDRGGPATAAELARAEQVTPQAVAATLSGLEARGLVERRPDPGDRRRVIMSLTRVGLDMVRHKRDVRAQQFAAGLGERFTPAELDTLAAAASLLQRLAETI
jgi:DNA-binding MarR family transcriptional regulator